MDITKSDRKNRFYGGLYSIDGCLPNSTLRGEFFSYSTDKGFTIIENKTSAVSGFDWNVDNTKFYTTWPCEFALMEYDYDVETGSLSKQFLNELHLNQCHKFSNRNHFDRQSSYRF